jgi:hypothetical protein
MASASSRDVDNHLGSHDRALRLVLTTFRSPPCAHRPDLPWRRFARRVRCSRTHPAGRSVRAFCFGLHRRRMPASAPKEPSLRFYLPCGGNWNLNSSERYIDFQLGAATSHPREHCVGLAAHDRIADLETPLPNAGFGTDRDGIFNTPVNHAIGSIGCARRPSL